MNTLATTPTLANTAADMLKAIAHPVRLQIIAILCQCDENVGNLAGRLNVKQPIVSQQLRILRMRGLVEVNRGNGHATYHLAEPHLKQMITCLQQCVGCRQD